jgi:hypothetical protein
MRVLLIHYQDRLSRRAEKNRDIEREAEALARARLPLEIYSSRSCTPCNARF